MIRAGSGQIPPAGVQWGDGHCSIWGYASILYLCYVEPSHKYQSKQKQLAKGSSLEQRIAF